MSRAGRHLVAMLAAFLASACTITTHVDPVPPGTIASLCIRENPAVWSKEFLPALRAELARHGIATTVHDGPLPPTCIRRLEYEAQWKWDVALYLRYADIRIYDGDALVGRATHDARDAFARLDKFGPTKDRLAKLVDALLAGVNRAGTAAGDGARPDDGERS